MLVIAPMPVDGIHDDFVKENLSRGRVMVPDLPMRQENITVLPVAARVKPVAIAPTKSDLEFEMEFDFPQRSINHTSRAILPQKNQK